MFTPTQTNYPWIVLTHRPKTYHSIPGLGCFEISSIIHRSRIDRWVLSTIIEKHSANRVRWPLSRRLTPYYQCIVLNYTLDPTLTFCNWPEMQPQGKGGSGRAAPVDCVRALSILRWSFYSIYGSWTNWLFPTTTAGLLAYLMKIHTLNLWVVYKCRSSRWRWRKAYSEVLRHSEACAVGESMHGCGCAP